MKTNPFAPLEKALGYRFKKKALLQQALTHPSFSHEQSIPCPDNQRLEYLGDAVLGLTIATHLYCEHPDAAEGELTKLRSRLANSETLHQLARELGLGPHLRLGKGETKSGGHERLGNLADALEAIVGAAFLDGGFPAAQKITLRVVVPLLGIKESSSRPANPKGLLQERLHARGCTGPIYHIVSEEGPPHARRYEVEVTMGGKTIGHGSGSSKRFAETAAAKQALDALDAIAYPAHS